MGDVSSVAQRHFVVSLAEIVVVSALIGILAQYGNQDHTSNDWIRLISVGLLGMIADASNAKKAPNYKREGLTRDSPSGTFCSHMIALLLFSNHRGLLSSLSIGDNTNFFSSDNDLVWATSILFFIVQSLSSVVKAILGPEREIRFCDILISGILASASLLFGIGCFQTLTLFAWNLLLVVLPYSFSAGEAFLAVLGLAFLFMGVDLGAPDHFVLLKGLILGTIFSGLVVHLSVFGFFLAKKIIFGGPGATGAKTSFLNRPMGTLTAIGMFLTLCIVFVLPWMRARMSIHPIKWLVRVVIEPSHTWMLLYWVVVMSVFLYFVDNRITVQKTAKTYARKYFHLVALLIFLPGLIFDPEFMHISYSICLCFFLFFEWVRASGFGLLSRQINDYISPYFDEKDAGILCASHIYLLLACALPLWLASPNCHPIIPFSGLLVVGVGDAVASIFGKKFGVRRIIGSYGSPKTWVGTLSAFFVTTILFFALSSAIGALDYRPPQVFLIVIVTFFSCLFEGVTEQNDNVLVALVYFVSLTFIL